MRSDYTDIGQISERLLESAEKLAALTDDVAKARHIANYDSERRKRALGMAVKPLLQAGESATAAEHKARASDEYAKAMQQLGKELIAAETTIALWEATKIKWESCRSMLSIQKAIAGNL